MSPVSRAAVARPANGGDVDPEGRSRRARNTLPPRRQLTASPTSKPLPQRANPLRVSEVGWGRLLEGEDGHGSEVSVPHPLTVFPESSCFGKKRLSSMAFQPLPHTATARGCHRAIRIESLSSQPW
ncbi:Vng6429h (plasmid) [Halobacterium salinarum NRC-1]|uniref:Spurious ORF n=1 Tax=Halobacterium salinarum (strain ATCC 700922 / JCM 11081 / NRC-1) TaxID=64091 RepID=Q9HHF5_HALSA|nr:Vng6429h [Halobacterium salinarum NRC-1]DAC80001.1 TPA_inf: spurious ORF [Halobacterium salinarum NRC-1]